MATPCGSDYLLPVSFRTTGQLGSAASNMNIYLAALLLCAGCCQGGLLGAGTGDGSCSAAPFRAAAVQWVGGCPQHAACCSEYGYCRGKEEWLAGGFRDCNGQSNGSPLAQDAIAAEQAAAAAGDKRGLALLEGSSGTPAIGSVIGEVAVGTGIGTVILGGGSAGAGAVGSGAVKGGTVGAGAVGGGAVGGGTVGGGAVGGGAVGGGAVGGGNVGGGAVGGGAVGGGAVGGGAVGGGAVGGGAVGGGAVGGGVLGGAVGRGTVGGYAVVVGAVGGGGIGGGAVSGGSVGGVALGGAVGRGTVGGYAIGGGAVSGGAVGGGVVGGGAFGGGAFGEGIIGGYAVGGGAVGRDAVGGSTGGDAVDVVGVSSLVGSPGFGGYVVGVSSGNGLYYYPAGSALFQKGIVNQDLHAEGKQRIVSQTGPLIGYAGGTGHAGQLLTYGTKGGVQPASTQLLSYGKTRLCKSASGYYYC